MRTMRIAVCAAAALAGACASPEDLGVEVANLIPPDQDDPCPPDGCGGGNSPVINGVYFWRLHTDTVPGEWSPDGVRITDVRVGSRHGRLQVVRGERLRVVHPTDDNIVLADNQAVVDTRITVEMNGAFYEIRVVAAAMSAWFWVGNQAPLWEYDLRYVPLPDDGAPPSGSLIPLCSEGDKDPTKVSAILFGGDLYNPVTKAITEGAVTAGWTNFACAYSAPYKMYRIGYTSAAGSRAGISTTLFQRRAMLNAWTSNLCGDGIAHTHQGEPIRMRESLNKQGNTSPYLGTMSSVEAIWNEKGAVCLTRHRLDDEQNPVDQDEEESDPTSEITDKLRNACDDPLPDCTGLVDNYKAYGYVLTGNP